VANEDAFMAKAALKDNDIEVVDDARP